MIRKFAGRGMMMGWLLGLALTTGVRGQAEANEATEGEDASVLFQQLIEVGRDDQAQLNDEQLPMLIGETSYEAAPSIVAPRVSEVASPPPQEIETSRVQVSIGDVSLFGYLATPSGRKPVAGLLMIHEWWGLNDAVKAEADHFARLGYRVFAIDLYAGGIATDRRQATALSRSLRQETALAAIGLWSKWLARPAEKGSGPLKVGVMGWGLGANYALQYALDESSVSALALFYGEVELELARLKKLPCPLLGIYAGRDGWVTPQRVEQFKDALAASHVDYSVVSYDALPGFMLNPQSLAEERAAKGSRKTLEAFWKRPLACESAFDK